MEEKFAKPAIGAIIERIIDGKKHIIIQERWKENSDEDLKMNHYTCFNTTGVCEELNYVFVIDDYTKTWNPYYVKLKNGKSLDDVINDSLYTANVNTNDSTVKKAVDYWFSSNMRDYTTYLEDTVWCNDRIISDKAGWNPNGGSVTKYLMFNSEKIPKDLVCPDEKNRFTVSDVNGNGALTYPTGLITRQELQLAYDNGNNPLSSGVSPYWIMSPGNFNLALGSVYITRSNGLFMFYNVNVPSGVRPSISLKKGVAYILGDGSVEKPYIIKTE